VEGLVVLNGNCDAHDWAWDPSDEYGCPVCYGIELEQGRVVELLTGWLNDGYGDFDKTFALIKGGNSA
jgi:hypothetical protein